MLRRCICTAFVWIVANAATSVFAEEAAPEAEVATMVWKLDLKNHGVKQPYGRFKLSNRVGKHVLAGGIGFCLIDCERRVVVNRYGSNAARISSLALSRDARFAVAVEGLGPGNWEIAEWDLKEKKRRLAFKTSFGANLRYVPDGRHVALWSVLGNRLQLRNMTEGKLRNEGRTFYCSISENGRWAITRSPTRGVSYMIDLSRWKYVASWRSYSEECNAISDDGARFVSGHGQVHAELGVQERGGEVFVHDGKNGRKICEFLAYKPGARPPRRPGVFFGVFDVAISAKGKRVAASTSTGIIVWDIDRKAVVAHLWNEKCKNFVFGNDGRELVTVNKDGIVKLWSLP